LAYFWTSNSRIFRINKSGLLPSSLRLIGFRLSLGEFSVIGRIYAHAQFSDSQLKYYDGRPNEDPEKIVKSHIKLLHKYNEVNVETQVLFL